MKKPIKMDTHAGQHIRSACEEAAVLAFQTGYDVEFEFNGVTMTVDYESQPEALVALFHEKLEAEAKAYRESPEGIARQKAREEEVFAKQQKIYLLIRRLPLLKTHDLVGNHDDFIGWVKDFVEPADDIGVTFDKDLVADFLEKAGYLPNECTGDSFIEGNKEVMARYIMGQVIDALRHGMPPHPITKTFCLKYEAMK